MLDDSKIIAGSEPKSHNEHSPHIEKGKEFIKEVAKYFMDFLESDFHKHKNPRRLIKLHNEDNLMVGINLSKYPSFLEVIWEAINSSFAEDSIKNIQKGVFKINIPENLLELIKIHINKISKKDINKLIEKISKEIQDEAILNKQEYDLALTNTMDNVSRIIKTTLVLPFLTSIEKPLDNLNLTDENGIYLMEVELTDILVKQLENKISEVLRILISKTKINIEDELTPLFELSEIKVIITNFFDTFMVVDLYTEVYELIKNQNILDKQDFYLYFCDITFGKVKYPIFYIPLAFDYKDDLIHINFDSQVYVNKKALEYIAQEFNNEQGKKGNLNTILDRIIYINDDKNSFVSSLQKILDEIVNFFNLDEKIDLQTFHSQLAKSFTVRASNNCYFQLFDKSDEALVNDYEEILQALSLEEGSILGGKFDSIINDFIYKDPVPFNPAIEEEWDNLEVSDKLIARSPIPLNSEQLQLLSSLRKDGCNYITVEGPPGTGKSHTITAIAFNAILEKKSILILSDKKEALDVVEDKITQTLNRVRLDKNFQNPLLRLGKIGSTYSQILATSSVEDIKVNYRVVKKNHESIDDDIEKRLNSLKEDIQAEIYSYNDINIQEIYEFLDLEQNFVKDKAIIDPDEISVPEAGTADLEELRLTILKLNELIYNSTETSHNDPYSSIINLKMGEIKNIDEINNYKNFLNEFINIITKIKETYGEDIESMKKLGVISDKSFSALDNILDKYEKERKFLLGFAFKKDEVKKIDIEFKSLFPKSTFEEPHKELKTLNNIFVVYESAIEFKKQLKNLKTKKYDFLELLSNFMLSDAINLEFKKIDEFEKNISLIDTFNTKYPKSSSLLGIKTTINSFYNNKLSKISDMEFDKLLRYISLMQKISKDFNRISLSDYVNQKKAIEDLMITQMTYIMDGRLIDFYENSRSTAKTLREIIKKKQKFPRDEFMKLKEAFPCILAGIRDYAEYIPLEPDIFDLVIIDEASQVSIAQAFPALLRAKKVLILGDKKQFSNVKAGQARSDTNTEYLNNLKSSFVKYISKENAKMVKMDKFNIKTSILDFFEFISNYNIQLRKHFRGYKELISYSDKYFYHNLEVMKIRAKKIDEVIKFKILKSDGKVELFPKTNPTEIDFIIQELQKMRIDSRIDSVGIITPHTDQQKLLMDSINKVEEKDYFFDVLNLKIMTFDTCQGEERDIIFYSMVATPEDDRLIRIFISDLNNVNIEEDGKIKAQRLNVGFSRAKETMFFVLSKPPEEYRGSIGQALLHYQSTLADAQREISIEETDKNSPMEKQVVNWFYQTAFWKNNKDRIAFFAQFEIGKYLRQLDKTYDHPAYKVDFLCVYTDENKKDQKIIIEYDGFNEHFKEGENINEFNYKEYYSDQDLYREKVLESYGYKFLRINRFNSGKNPIETLNNNLEKLLRNHTRVNPLLDDIHFTIEKLQNGSVKECPKCGELREAYQFEDQSLITGVGKFCNICKKKSISTQIPIYLSEFKPCPVCNSKMVLRTGKYGKFYGCSKFPYCRGTRKFN